MKICPYCGHQNEDDFVFCEECGKTIPEAASADTDAPKTEPTAEVPVAETPAAETPAEEEPAAEASAAEAPIPEEPKAQAVCPKCGAPIAPEAVFCKTCGANLKAGAADTQTAKKPSVNFSDILAKLKGFFGTLKGKIVLGIVALLIVLGILALCLMGSPKNKVLMGIKNTYNALQKTEVYTTAFNVMNHGSIRVKGELDYGVIDGFDVTLKLGSKSTKAEAIFDGEFKNGNPLSAHAWLSPDSLVVESKDVLGSGAYGVDLSRLGTSLQNSVFSSDSDSRYAGLIPRNVEEMLVKMEGKLDLNKYETQISSISESATKELADLIFKYGDIDKERDEVDFGEKEIKVDQIEVELDAKAMRSVARDMVKWLKKDSSIKKLLREADKDTALMCLMTEAGMGEDFSFEDEWDDLVEEMEDNLPDDLEEFDEITLLFGLYGNKLVQFRIKTAGLKYEVLVGPDPSKPAYIAVKSGEGAAFTYRVETNTSKEYEADIRLDGSKYSVSWDKKEGDFRIKTDYDTIKGNMKRSGSKTEIELSISDLESPLKITLNESDGPSSAPKYTEVLKMSEEEVDDLAEKIEDNLEYYYY